MHPITHVLEELFAIQGWRYVRSEDNRYSLGFRIDCNRYDLVITFSDHNGVLSVYVRIPVQASAGSLGEVSEYIARVNWDMSLGCFELDFADGEIRYRLSSLFRNRIPDSEDIHEMMDIALAMADLYYPGFGSIIYGGRSAETAAKEAESR